MEYCPECKNPKEQSEMTTLPASKKNVIRRCCKGCKKRIMEIRRGIKKMAKKLAK